MIPFFELREPVLPGGVTLGVSGVLVLTGTAVGIAFAQRRARVLGLPHGAISGAILGALGAGFLVSHAVELIPYRPDPLEREYPRALLDFWNGPISFEGFCAARAGRPADFA